MSPNSHFLLKTVDSHFIHAGCTMKMELFLTSWPVYTWLFIHCILQQ